MPQSFFLYKINKSWLNKVLSIFVIEGTKYKSEAKMKEQNLIREVGKAVPVVLSSSTVECPPPLHTWYFKDMVQAERMAHFFEGLSMIMRVNRENNTVDLIGFEDDDKTENEAV